jgi:hypothetical protein
MLLRFLPWSSELPPPVGPSPVGAVRARTHTQLCWCLELRGWIPAAGMPAVGMSSRRALCYG